MHRWAEEEDKAAVMKLWSVAFESYEPYYSWYFNEVYRPELTLGDFRGSALAAALQLAPYTLHLPEGELPVCYVVGVVTEPAFRGQGLGHALLREAHRRMDSLGYGAALLYTDIPAFYKPLGYRHRYWQQVLRLPLGRGELQLPSGEAFLADTSLIDAPLELQHAASLGEIYRPMTAGYEGYILRNERNWRLYLGEHICDGGRLLLWPGRAYVIYTLSRGKLHIIELGFRDEQALGAALGAAVERGLREGAGELQWQGPQDAPDLLPDIPAACWCLRPFVMMRGDIDFSSAARPLWINEYT